jgi:hypothetical protein
VIALWKIGIGVAVAVATVISVAVLAGTAAPLAQQRTRADALAAFDRRRASIEVPAGATPTPVSEAQRQAWADGWLASAAKGNTEKACDKNIDAVPGKPTNHDLLVAWADGYFFYCGIRAEDMLS